MALTHDVEADGECIRHSIIANLKASPMTQKSSAFAAGPKQECLGDVLKLNVPLLP